MASLSRLVFLFVLVAAGALSIMRSLVFLDLHPAHALLQDQGWLEAMLWCLVALVALALAKREDDLNRLFAAWSSQHWLLAFLAICLASWIWSVDRSASSYRIVVLLAASWVAAYLGTHCRSLALLRYISVLGAVVVLASIATALALPIYGTDQNPGFEGIWRGIFWNKNQLGASAAFFGAVFLLRVAAGDRSLRGAGPWLALYAGTLLLVVRAESAAGYLLTMILGATVLHVVFWPRLSSRMTRKQRLGLYLTGATLLALALTNLDIVLGLFNRTTTLTGRTKLWNFLLAEFVSERPWFGYGFGALWEGRDFRFLVKDTLGWTHQAMMGDNGFMDILLNVGLMGLGVFLAAYAKAWRTALDQWHKLPEVADGLPLLIMVFSLFANISFSLLAEIEMLVWCLLVIVLFSGSTGLSRHWWR